jgi:hypothetical protein
MATTDRLGDLTPEQRALCLGARTGLDEMARERLVATAAAGLDWDRLWSLGHLHEVIPLLSESLPDALGDAVPAEWLERARRRRFVTLSSNGRLAETLVAVLSALDAAGIAALPVKGLVIGDQLYGSLSLRPAADLDVLVRPDDLPAARAVLREIGFSQREEPGFKALTHEFHDPAWGRGSGHDHVRLELHWALWSDSERRLGTAGLWERSVTATLLDHPVRILSPEDTLLHLAIHRTRSALRLRWVVDIAELLRRHGPGLDWPAYLDRARIAGARTASWVVLGLAADLLGASPPVEVMDELRVGAPKRAILARTCGVGPLFRDVPDGELSQQPHLTLRSFEEDGPVRIARVLGAGLIRPVREALHDAGILRARRRMA